MVNIFRLQKAPIFVIGQSESLTVGFDRIEPILKLALAKEFLLALIYHILERLTRLLRLVQLFGELRYALSEIALHVRDLHPCVTLEIEDLTFGFLQILLQSSLLLRQFVYLILHGIDLLFSFLNHFVCFLQFAAKSRLILPTLHIQFFFDFEFAISYRLLRLALQIGKFVLQITLHLLEFASLLLQILFSISLQILYIFVVFLNQFFSFLRLIGQFFSHNFQFFGQIVSLLLSCLLFFDELLFLRLEDLIYGLLL